jgi:adenylate kinase family enzyme
VPLLPNLPDVPRLERGVFLLLGASGSGKGSVGAALLERGAITAHASMGAWLREALLNPASLGSTLEPLQPADYATPLEYLRHCVSSGLLIPDAWTQAVIEQRLAVAPVRLWLLDGYPRTVGAARHLIAALEGAGIALLGAVHLRVSDDVAMQRLLARGRMDDEETAILERLEFYRSSVLPSLEWLKARGIAVVEVSAEQQLESVVSAVERVLDGWRETART